ncbi:hypothetical protein ACFL6S_24605 [Candidatus Poribacteria bacterium]
MAKKIDQDAVLYLGMVQDAAGDGRIVVMETAFTRRIGVGLMIVADGALSEDLL